MTQAHLRALDAVKGVAPTASNITKLGKEYGVEETAWALGQLNFRQKARRKFAKADEMFFYEHALEQSTHEAVAAYHASLFPKDALVADLTCSIGADLIGLASRGPSIGFDIDANRIWCAQQNLLVHDLISQVSVEDSLAREWDFEYAFADPARRIGSRRTLDISEFEPDPVALSNRMQALKLGLLKLTPMLSDSELENLGTRVEFVSHQGECKEALVFCGSETFEPGFYAVHIETGAKLSRIASPQIRERPMQFIFDPDPALIRVHGLGHLASNCLGRSNYLTADEIPAIAEHKCWHKAYRVLAEGTFDTKELKKILKKYGCCQPELKQSGADIDLAALQKQLRQPGTQVLNVLFYKVGKSVRFAVAHPVNP